MDQLLVSFDLQNDGVYVSDVCQEPCFSKGMMIASTVSVVSGTESAGKLPTADLVV